MAERADAGQNGKKPERIGILVVHGIGEQKRFDCLEEVASHFYRALRADGVRSAHLQIFPCDPAARGAETGLWQASPVRLRWEKPGDGKEIEASFWEVHWADLDMPKSVRNWLRFVGWALGMSGVRPFRPEHTTKESSSLPGMETPASNPGNLVRARIELFGISCLFFLLLLSIDLLYFVARRFSFQARWLADARSAIYNYLGDVKLYQDGFDRDEEGVETVGERTRVAIQRRMVREMVRMAKEVDAGRLDGYYIFAHSLGTVVAFNGLMQHELILPHYLNETEWSDLPPRFKKDSAHAAPPASRPRRPAWLGPNAAMDRAGLFSGLRGFLTVGSPLDKFATLWPALVPTNGDAAGATVPWVNVADVQDLVAGGPLDLLWPSGASDVGPLNLRNIDWADQKCLLKAHTSYWKWEKGRQDRLMDRVVVWLEGGAFVPPGDRLDKGCAKAIYWTSLGLGSVLLWWVTASLMWLGGQLWKTWMPAPLSPGIVPNADMGGGLVCRYLKETGCIGLWVAVVGVVVVFACSCYRYWVLERENVPSQTPREGPPSA